jgi:putative flippase GtrA
MIKPLQYIALFTQLFRFGVVGLSAAAIHFCIVVLLVQNNIYVPLIANVFAFAISFQFSYWGHRLWTFSDTVTEHREAYPKLVAVQLLNLAASESLFYLFLSLHLPYQVALLIVLSILPLFTFTASKLWIFR